MELGLSDKNVLVAGSSRGIGKAIARAFLSEGCRATVTGREQAAISTTAREFEAEFGPGRALTFVGDLTQRETIRDLCAEIRQHWGGVHCIVANIGTGGGVAGVAPGEAEWERLLSQNLLAGARLVEEGLPLVDRSGTGSIVFVASIAGVEALPAPVPYSVAKAALVSYSKNLARLLGSENVRANCVAPGNILFPGSSWEGHLTARREAVETYVRTEVPLRRFGRPEEIADLVVFLASARASFVTGACLTADGGQTRSR